MKNAQRHQPPPAVASPSDALRRLIGRGSVYTVTLAIQMSTALLAVPWLTRLLSPAAYGQVAVGLVIFALLSVIGALGLAEAAARTFFAGAEGPRQARRLIAAASCTAVLFSLVAELTGGLWAPLFGLSYGGVLRVAVWGGAAAAMLLGAQSLLRVSERMWMFLGVAIVATVGGQALGVTLAALLHSATAYMAGIAAGTAVAAAVGLIGTGCLGSGVAAPAEMKTGLALGLPIVPHSLAVSLLVSADRIIIVGILGLAAAGRYQVAYAVGGLGVALVTALNQAWLPLLLGARNESRWEILRATSAVVHLVAGIVAITLALAAPLALAIAAPPSYGRHGLVAVAAIVAFSALPYATCSTYFHAVFVSGRTRVMAIAAPVAAAVNIGLNLVLLHAIGLIGAAVATVAGYAVLPAVVAVAAHRIAPLAGTTRDALRTWLLAAPFVAAGALIPAGAPGAGARIVAIMVAAVGATLLLRAATRHAPAVTALPVAQAPAATPADAPDGGSQLQPAARLPG
jgi:O-antigen/teichoic acid export membrane protein